MFLSIVLLNATMLLAADKPSPFAVRKSEPAVPAAAPVAPVLPVRMFRPNPVVVPMGATAIGPVVAPVVAPVSPAAAQPVRRAAALVTESPQQQPAVAIPAAAPAVPAERPKVETITAGTLREEAIGLLGKPASSVSMYEDSGFVESLRYEWKGSWIGTVRLAGGKVIRVDRPQ